MIEQMAERLKKLRMEVGLSRQQVADRIGCTVAAIGAYEQGVSQPPADVLRKLAVMYKSSADYILGISYDKSFDMSELSSYQQSQIIDFVRELIAFLGKNNKK